jgi:hypothetical protein
LGRRTICPNWTGFADRFTHLRTGDPVADKPALLAAILADGTNLGLSRMATDISKGAGKSYKRRPTQFSRCYPSGEFFE